FFVNAAIGIVWILICAVWFKNFPSEMKNISEAEKQKIESGCRHNKQQHLIPLKYIFRNSTVWSLMFMYFCLQWANYFFVAWMPVYLQEGRHFSEEQAKRVIFFVFVAGMVGLLAGGFTADWFVRNKGLRFGRRFTGMTGIGMSGVLIFLTAFIHQNNIAAITLVAANACYGFCVMSSYAVCNDIARNNSGTVTGAMNFFGQAGAFFLAIVFGNIVQATNNFNYPLFVVAFVLAIGFLLWLLIDPLKQLNIPENVEKAST
ncbi:MAG TPA: MFS transporter, partial [Parafilimonas sp.]|nr:MFS transporter [Parafilimonas sp.]